MDFLSRHKRAFFISLVIICLLSVLITLGLRIQPSFFHNTLGYVVTPLQKGLTDISGWFSRKISFAVNITDTEQENLMLLEELEQMKVEINRLQQMEAELNRMEDLYQLDQKYPNYPKVGARIIAKDVSNWYNTFIIDKGALDGLMKNMVVLADGGLAGKIMETGPHYAKVIPLIDDSSSVSAQSVRTEDIGFVQGDLQLRSSGLCIMEYIDPGAEIIEGDEIVTSYLSEFFPPGLTIGYVQDIRTDTSSLNKYAIIQPVADFKNLDTVLVITQNFHEDYLGTLSEAYKKTREE